MVVKYSGKVHPYIEDLPIFEDKVDEFAESIDEVGLLHPITLDEEGQVIGGRHRLAACEVAGIDPEFEVREGDPLPFMLHDNDARKHQTAGQLAAEKALTLDSAGMRNNGRWAGNKWSGSVGQFPDPGIEKSMRNNLSYAGLVLDVLGREVLAQIAQGDLALDAAHRQAKAEKDRLENAERRKVEAAQAEEEREAYAADYFANHPAAQEWLNSKPEGVFETARSAFAAYQEHDREARAAEEERRREEEQRQREHLDSLKRDANRLKGFLTGYGQAWGMREHPHRDHVLNMLEPTERKRFITIEGEITWPETKH